MIHYNLVIELMDYALNKIKNKKKEVPVYALILNQENTIIAASHNHVNCIDVTAHAEKIVMLKAAKLYGYRDLNSFTLISSLEPCDMCQEICRLYRLNSVYFSAYNFSKMLNTPKNWIGGILLSKGEKIVKECFLRSRQSKIE